MEFLNGVTKLLGYGYIGPDEVVNVCVDNGINFKNFYNLVGCLDEYQMEDIAMTYIEESEDLDAEDYLNELEDNNDTNKVSAEYL